MLKNKLVLIGLVMLIIGGLIGLAIGYQLAAREVKELPVVDPVIDPVVDPAALVIFDLLKSPTVHYLNVTVFGEVFESINRTLIVTAENETLAVPIREDAIITLFIHPEPVEEMVFPEPVQKTIQFEEIELGDMINILAEITLLGEIEGIYVAVDR